MFLSIIIPTRNRFSQLKQCLTALCNNRIATTDSEIIVIDDASAKGHAQQSQTVCSELGAAYYYQKVNKGAAASRNIGIKRSSGQWVAFIDDDVCVEDGWKQKSLAILRSCANEILGIEGRVRASGGGVWDREVENNSGGRYLSCHMFYRRDILTALGAFDECFSSRYPSCEDHELACRVRAHGHIAFRSDLEVVHLPREIRLLHYIGNSWYRMRTQLESELHFYLKHPDKYHLLRHCRTFWGTYWVIATRHWYATVKRRKMSVLLTHPMQLLALLLACGLEQVSAVALFPNLLTEYLRPAHRFFWDIVDKKLTLELWRLPVETTLRILALKPRLFRKLLFPIVRLPVYDLKPFFKTTGNATHLTEMNLFLRIDDVFLKDEAAVEHLCEVMNKQGIPFCAAITGDDLALEHNHPLLRRIVQSGGRIGLHGFLHEGNFGPFKSELIQMPFPMLSARLREIMDPLPDAIRPKILIPPFNAISRDQIVHCAGFFKVICGGPETVRFTDGCIGPVALPGRAWYFASVQPLYGAARNMLQSSMVKTLNTIKGFGCITVHMPEETYDGFAALSQLMIRIKALTRSWDYFIKYPDQCYSPVSPFPADIPNSPR